MKISTCAIAGLVATLTAILSGAPQPTAANTSWVESFACPKGISIYAVEDDPALPAPRVVFGLIGKTMNEARLIGVVSGAGVPGGKGRQFVYWAEVSLTAGAKGTVTAYGQRNESYGSFTVADACAPLGSVRGVAFEDLNANGAREANEPVLTGAWWKLTAGGDWSICGYSGDDGTFGPTVKPSTYTLLPIAAPGFRATTPARTALVRRLGEAALNNDIGFVRDARARGDVCGQYDPRPAPVAVAGGTATSVAAELASSQYTIFNTFLITLKAAGLYDTLGITGDVTVFAPTDAAFAKLSKTTLDRLLANPKELSRVLRGHIVTRRLSPEALAGSRRVRALSGEALVPQARNGVLRLNGRAAVAAPIQAGNGLIYPIDTVLFVAAR
jgi:uncharacterized surface protein with fasciclin (FAS1) repeats